VSCVALGRLRQLSVCGLLGIALASAPAFAKSNTEPCLSLLDLLGGPARWQARWHDIEWRYQTLHENFETGTVGGSLLHDLLKDVGYDFNLWHRGTGLVAQVYPQKVSWRDSDGVARTEILPTLGIRYVARFDRNPVETKIGILLKHRLRTSPGIRFRLDPFSLFDMNASGAMQVRLDGRAREPVIYLNLRDLYSFYVAPKVALHELSHLDRYYRWLRWLERGPGRFYAPAGSLMADGKARAFFDHSYLGKGFMSLDEQPAHKVSVRVALQNLRLSFADPLRSRRSKRRDFAEFHEILVKNYDVNDDLLTALEPLSESLDRYDESAMFWVTTLGKEVHALVAEFEHESSGETLRVLVPYRPDFGNAADARLMQHRKRETALPTYQLPMVIREELMASLAPLLEEARAVHRRTERAAIVLRHYNQDSPVEALERWLPDLAKSLESR